MKRGDERNKLGDAIYAARERKGISTPKLAERVGLNRNNLRRIQLGDIRQPRPATLTRIAEELDLVPAELFALAGYETASELPDLRGWLNVKHRDLPDEAVESLQGHLDYLVYRHQQEQEQREEDS